MYRTLLARRLLGRRSKSDDAERVMISRFKARCGVNFTSKLEGMFTDISTCEDRLRCVAHTHTHSRLHPRTHSRHVPRSGFDAFAKAEGLAVDDLEFRARVLTQGHWPTFLHVDAVLPESMAAFTQAFEVRGGPNPLGLPTTDTNRERPTRRNSTCATARTGGSPGSTPWARPWSRAASSSASMTWR